MSYIIKHRHLQRYWSTGAARWSDHQVDATRFDSEVRARVSIPHFDGARIIKLYTLTAKDITFLRTNIDNGEPFSMFTVEDKPGSSALRYTKKMIRRGLLKIIFDDENNDFVVTSEKGVEAIRRSYAR